MVVQLLKNILMLVSMQGLNVEGINAEVATGQWEFQIFAKGAKQAGDEIWVARYLLERIGENMVSRSTGIANHWEILIGMVAVCTLTSQMA
jgi:glutamine synthetase